MAANSSVAARGPKDAMLVMPPTSVGKMQLEEHLAEAMGHISKKEEELVFAHNLLAKLERAVEQQASVSQLDQNRLSTLEAALAQQQGIMEEREKHHAQVEEKALRDGVVQAMAPEKTVREMQDELANAEALHREDERKVLELQGELAQLEEVATEKHHAKVLELQGKLKQMEEVATEKHHAKVLELQGKLEHLEKIATEKLQDKLTNAEALHLEDERKVLELQGKLARLEEQLRTAAEPPGLVEDKRNKQVTELQHQLLAEKSARHEAQQQVLLKEMQLAELRQQLVGEKAKNLEVGRWRLMVDGQGCKSQDVEDLSLDKDRTPHQTQQNVNKLSWQIHAQELMIERERELCKLQEESIDELIKTRAKQRQVLQKNGMMTMLLPQLLGLKTEKNNNVGSEKPCCSPVRTPDPPSIAATAKAQLGVNTALGPRLQGGLSSNIPCRHTPVDSKTPRLTHHSNSKLGPVHKQCIVSRPVPSLPCTGRVL